MWTGGGVTLPEEKCSRENEKKEVHCRPIASNISKKIFLSDIYWYSHFNIDIVFCKCSATGRNRVVSAAARTRVRTHLPPLGNTA